VSNGSTAAIVPGVTIDADGTHDVTETLSNNAKRKLEDLRAIGAYATPHTALQKLPEWLPVGKRMQRVLWDFVQNNSEEVDQTLASIGDDKATGFSPESLRTIQQALAVEFHVKLTEDKLERRAALLRAILVAAGDPDTHVADWAAGQTPLGITQPLPHCGIFPPAGAAGVSLESVTDLVMSGELPNYESCRQHADKVEEALKADRAKWFLVWSTSKAELEREVGTLILSRMAALVKTKNGKTKTRLIHDLRRSLVNRLANLPERIVLPRLLDAIQALLLVLRDGDTTEDIDLLVLDFEDAFNQMFVHLAERRFLAGRATIDGEEWYFYYRSVLFGHIAGPLLWGRVAAALMRCTAALVAQRRVGLQCYVDDPILALGGPPVARRKSMALVLILWDP